jgi:hypothetical protein
MQINATLASLLEFLAEWVKRWRPQFRSPRQRSRRFVASSPDRLDLNDIHAHMGKTKGVKIAISTDAYSVNAFQYMRFGVDQARRAWLTADDVINTRQFGDLRKLLKRRVH